jgi:ribose 5-phosphate isomerase B
VTQLKGFDNVIWSNDSFRGETVPMAPISGLARGQEKLESGPSGPDVEKGKAVPVRIAIASDHRGFEAKKRLAPALTKLGYEIQDFGCEGTTAVDYPDYAVPVSQKVACGDFNVGILLDGSGIGMSIVANKLAGIRAALVHDEVTARRAREHNHCNVLCLGTDLLSEDQIRKIVEIFLNTPFGDGRHVRRIEKLQQVEREQHAPA